jgi:hypothetical protein
MRRWFPLLGLLVAGSVAAYWLRPAPVPAADFTDTLTGPDSPHLVIPFDKYTLTPEGLLREHSASGRSNGDDRPVVRTRSDRYFARDFIFEVDVTIPEDTEEIVFIGFGDGTPTAPYNEPGGVFGFRIHHMQGNREVRLAAVTQPQRGGSPNYLFQDTIGTVPAGGALTVRLERSGDHITASLPGQDGSERTIRISAYPSILRGGRGFLYLSNTTEGTIFSNVRVRPRT